jgi:hypothetical protein
MKQGKELGQAITEAIPLAIDGVRFNTKADVARALGIEPPSLHNWMRTGRISPHKKMAMLDLFSTVTTPQHWGLEDWPNEVYADPDAHVFVEIAVNTTLPITVAQQVLELISKNAIER